MRPSKIKAGTKLFITPSLGDGPALAAYFIKRVPAQSGVKAKNFLVFPEFAGLNDVDDAGICEMSDYDLSRRGQIAKDDANART